MANTSHAIAVMYDKRANDYENEASEDFHSYTSILDEVIPMIPAGKGSVVDLGCGPGHMLEYLSLRIPAHHPLIGIDLSSKLLQHAKERLPETTILKECAMMDVTKYVADNSAALILSAFTFSFLSPTQLLATISSAAKSLGKGGVLLFVFWTKSDDSDDSNDTYEVAPGVTCYTHTIDAVTCACQQAGKDLELVSQETKRRDLDGMEMDYAILFFMKRAD
eukprot:TRINITY_DN11382_c0_g1_i1.p1 TRINITY_DN11382_c0_g1~~TRINITY_DN11382_c0_g1_i1.p1  ORF type:complete len:221 (+),score=27.64 TRINITY_DN11382_c0_g1_i1:174-836(+)